MKGAKTGKKRLNTLASFIITIIILTTLLLAGPASAITVNINGSTTANEATAHTLTVSVDIEENENVPVQNITFVKDGTECTFDLAGNKLSGCSGITISKNHAVGYNASASNQFGYGYGYDAGNATYATRNYTFSTGYGYGYVAGYGYAASAYGYGELSYDITFTTKSVTSAGGTHTISAYVSTLENKRYKVTSDFTLTVNNVASGGSSNTGDSSGSSSSGGDSTTPQQQGVVTDNELITSLLDIIDPSELGVLALDPDQVEVTLETTRTAKESVTAAALQEALAEAETPEAQAAIQGLIDAINSGENKQASVGQKLEVFKVRNKENGQVVYKTKVTLTVEVDGESEVVTFVHVIPKDVAADVLDVTFTGAIPEILQADPIVKWTFTDVNEDQDVSYIVDGEVTSMQSKSVAAAKPKATPQDASDTTGDDTQPTGEEEGASLLWLWILLAAVVIAVVIAIVVGVTREKRVQ
jgi:hypothetical protein